MDRLQQEMINMIIIVGMMAYIFVLGTAIVNIIARVGIWIMEV